MIQTGTVTKIEGPRVWAQVRPEGGTCADCSCDKPVRTIEARLAGNDTLAPGDQVIIESSRLMAGISALVLIAMFLGGGIIGWNLAGSGAGQNMQAAASMGGAFAGLIVAVLAFSPLRRRQLPLAKRISLTLHRQSQDS